MKPIWTAAIVAVLLGGLVAVLVARSLWTNITVVSPHEGTLHEFTATSLDGKDIKLSEYKGQVALVVNTASRCGLTPQYKGLEALYDKYKDRKFVVLGFPSNNFGNQEPGTNEQIAEFCEVNYGVSFPMFSKIDVNGPNRHPIYKWLVSNTDNKDIEWNFGKFLIDREGKIVKRFGPRVNPDDPELIRALEAALDTN